MSTPHRRPAIGDIVHYVSYGTPPREDGSQTYPPACRAAIVTARPWVSREDSVRGLVSLAVLSPAGAHFDRVVPFEPWGTIERRPDNAQPVPGSWHWMCE